MSFLEKLRQTTNDVKKRQVESSKQNAIRWEQGREQREQEEKARRDQEARDREEHFQRYIADTQQQMLQAAQNGKNQIILLERNLGRRPSRYGFKELHTKRRDHIRSLQHEMEIYIRQLKSLGVKIESQILEKKKGSGSWTYYEDHYLVLAKW